MKVLSQIVEVSIDLSGNYRIGKEDTAIMPILRLLHVTQLVNQELNAVT